MATTITNKHGLPEEFVRAVKVDKHVTIGDISTTQLIDAPQVRYLKRRNDIQVDAMDMMWALFGTAVHHILELSAIEHSEHRKIVEATNILDDYARQDPNFQKIANSMKNVCDHIKPETESEIMSEVTLHKEVNGYTFSGTIDRFNKRLGRLSDYKVCSVYNYIYPEAKKKWAAQQNVYAYLLREHGYEVNELEIIAIFRDWSRSSMHRNRDYPPAQVVKIPIEIIEHKRMQKYIEKRIELHKQADLGNVAECTGKERWAKPNIYAAMVPGGKRSLKNFTEESLAKSYVLENEKKFPGVYIETRYGEDVRCDQFCPVAEVCPQRKKKLEMLNKK